MWLPRFGRSQESTRGDGWSRRVAPRKLVGSFSSMSSVNAPGTERADSPSMLDLVRLSPRRVMPPGGRELYRQIASLTDMRPGQEVLSVAAGKGSVIEYFV